MGIKGAMDTTPDILYGLPFVKVVLVAWLGLICVTPGNIPTLSHPLFDPLKEG